MGRTVYINGSYLPEDEAKISVFDRGFLMADSVYEVTMVLDGKLCDFPGHMARLARSLDALDIPAPLDEPALIAMHRELINRNALIEGGIYLQITRGAHDRDFLWPDTLTPTVVAFTQARDLVNMPSAVRGIAVVTVPDIRWGRRDIKTTQLLGAALAKNNAHQAGADDAWFVEDGFVTEGSSNNAWIITADGTLLTRHLSNHILHGITRKALMRYAGEVQMKVEERPFTILEAQAAQEAFITSAGSLLCPVVKVDGVAIGSGEPGPITQRLRALYIEESRKAAT
ncbi:MAG: D-amino-acid transaminase [Paracoccaceae bacterium]